MALYNPNCNCKICQQVRAQWDGEPPPKIVVAVWHPLHHDIPARVAALPTDSQARKDMPIYSGVIFYFPLALAAIAKHSKESNDKHNPGEALHWSREKSSDHLDCIARHMADRALADARGDKQAALVEQRAIAWRALAQLELDEEAASV